MTTTIVFDNCDSARGKAATLTFNFTIGSAKGTNRLLVIGVGVENGEVSTVHYDNRPAYFVAVHLNGALRTYLYYILDVDLPATADCYSLQVFGSAGLTSIAAAVMSVKGAQQGAPEVFGQSGVASSKTISTPVTPLTTGALAFDVVATLGGDVNSLTAGSGQTRRQQQDGSSSDVAVSTKPVSPPGSSSLSWTFNATASRAGHVVAAWAPAPATQPVSTLTFTGNSKIVVHSTSATKEQRFQIESAQNPGTLAGTVGAVYDVVAAGASPWVLRLQQKVGSSFVDRSLIKGPSSQDESKKIQFVIPADSGDITARVEQLITQPETDFGSGLVRGLVTDAEGQPLSATTLSVFAQKVRGEDVFLGGPVTTGTDGRYVVVYRRTQATYNLYVEAERGDSLVRSGVVMNAGEEEVVDLTFGGAFKGASDLDRYRQLLTPVLSAEGLQISDLAQSSDKELAVLSARSGVQPVDLALLKQSVVLGQQTGLSHDIFYGFGRQNIPLSLPAILAQDPDARRAALEEALASNQISGTKRAEVDAALSVLSQRSVTAALADPTLPGETTLGGLLATAGLSAAKRQALATTLVGHSGTTAQFWDTIRQNGTLTTQEIAKTQFSLQLGTATQNHLPLVQAIQSRGVTDFKALTQFDRSGWLALVRSQVGDKTVGVPPDLRSAGVSDETYADMLFTIVEDAVPTALFARQASGFPRAQSLTEFYTRNPGYDVRAAPLNTFLQANPSAVDFITDATERSAFVSQLKGMERIFRIAPAGARVSSVQTLLNADIHSAQQVFGMGRSAFLRNFGASLGQGFAERLFARATGVANVAALLRARYGAGFDRAPFAVTPPRPASVTALGPDYETLFGSLDFCSCEHCQSAFSPAAYLVDVLHWLDTRPRTSGKTPLTVLFQGRRADIGTIELSCSNTNTALPYLDLVNEVLELQVSPQSPQPAYQTRAEAGDLLAHPEHLHAAAYDVVAGAAPGSGRDGVYPFNLPFNLWLAEARTYLGHLGLTRASLMEAFHALGGAAALLDVGIANEALELSPLEADVIAGAALTPPRTPQELWGLAGDAAWLTKLQRVSIFLSQASPALSRDGMDYAELTDLWRTGFVQGAGAVGIWFDGVTCDTTQATLPGLSEAHLARIHRFVRLRRRLAWSASELDLAIRVLGGGALSGALLVKLASVRRLQRALGLDLPQLLAWWGSLDTRRWANRLVLGRPAGIPASAEGRGFVFNAAVEPIADEADDESFYDRLFLSRSVESRSVEPEPKSAFGLRADGAALLDETPALALHSPAIAAALGITADELNRLTPGLPNDRLSLSNLSALYRHVSLARALGLDIGSLVSLLALTGKSPFDPAHPENAVLFVEEVKAVRASGFSVAELDYLLTHVDTKPATLEPRDEDTGVLLLELRDLLRKVIADSPAPPANADIDQLRERLSRELSKLVSADLAGRALSLVDLAPGQSVPAAAEALIDEALSFLPDVEAAKNALARPAHAAYLTDRAQRLRFVLEPLVAFRLAQATRATVIEKLGASLGLEPVVAAPIFEQFLRHPAAGGSSMVEVFSAPALVAYDQTDPDSDAPRVPAAADFPDPFAAYKRLHKVALVLSHFRTSKAEVAWLFEGGPARGTLNFQDLPIVPPTAAGGLYAAWARLRDAWALRDRVAAGTLFDLFEAATAVVGGSAAARAAAFEALLDELVERTRWNRKDIEFLVGAPARGTSPAVPSALGLVYPDDFRDERGMKRVETAMIAVRRIGLSAESLWPWRTVPAVTGEQSTQALDIKQAVRARLGEARWRETTRPLRDALREKQRDALASWLIGNADFADVLSLFDHLLLDVQMSACQLSSRVKQAISSVQLFVQRALLNVETQVKLDEGDVREWRWMKNYRVWEANRKVFLYPENYIEPELRDDKTPFFKELEDELLQGELTDAAAERAVLGYLEKLDDVARLEIAGLCQHQEAETNVLHVFGRTRSAPHRYFHRQWVDGTHWTPWEKLELDIEGDQIVPIVHNRRLYLFWLVISETAVEEVSDTPQRGGDNSQNLPQKYFQVRVAWSERRSSKWASKKLSAAQIGATDDDYNRLNDALVRAEASARSQLFLTISTAGGDLLLQPVRYKPKGTVTISLPSFLAIPSHAFSMTSPEAYVRMDRFRFSGADGTMTLESSPSLVFMAVHRPPGTTIEDQSFASTTLANGLVIPWRQTVTAAYEERRTLGATPSAFHVVPTGQLGGWSASPFFFEDLKRTFFVVPRPPQRLTLGPATWLLPDRLGIDLIGNLLDVVTPDLFLRPLVPRPDPRFFELRSTVVDSASIFVDKSTRLLPGSGTSRGGALLASTAATFLDRLGPGARAFGGDTVAFRAGSKALNFDGVIRGATGDLVKLASPASPSVFRDTLTPGSVRKVFDVPELRVSIEGLAPALVRLLDTPFRFHAFYHPFATLMMRQLNRFGLSGLLDPAPDGPEPTLVRQQRSDEFFEQTYQPKAVSRPYPKDDFDFSYGGAYSAYNWELFFHVPFLVAVSLTKNRRFEEALRWFHFVFDPSESDGEPAPQRFWKIRPFFELFFGEDIEAGPIHELLLLLQYTGSEPEKLDAKQNLIEQIRALSQNPFNPHALARLRPVAYQKAIVIKYIDNLIQWGDELFRRDTLESINEATLLYVLSARLLGRRPRQVAVDPPAPRTFNELRSGLDELGNALVEIEGYVSGVSDVALGGAESDPPVLGRTLFFCVPPNDKLLADGWNRVEDRLFKIRHCMNIEGVVRQLPLFEPPIDPALLVRAAAAGIDLGSILNDVGGALPLQRYTVLAQRALELCNDVRGLGQALLVALEKKDGEALALLRADQEIRLLSATVEVRERQIDEAKEQLESLRRSREMAEIRLRYYRSREFMNGAEKAQFALLAAAGLLDVASGVVNLFGAAASAFPDLEFGAAGFGGSPVFTTRLGGTTVSNVASKVAEGLRVGASALDRAGSLAGILGSYERREDEWEFLGDQAQKEIEQLDRSLLGAEIRVAIAEKELDNHRLQIEQSREVEDFLRSKFTSEQLYSWMVGQISSLYFRSYQLAYDVARRAERAWQFELAQPNKSFIQFGYWDGLKKGLLAGDRLYFDIQRMATSYLEENRREYELTRHVSLRLLDPLALISLRRDGQCFVRIPEAWFDLDSAGHYLRRLKTVSVSVPSVTGPYVSVRLTLTLVASSMRTSPDATAPYARTGQNDARFRDNVVGIQSIVTSRAEDDAGLFETNLRDERYLPFEGAGAISEWRLELPSELRQFDYETISDVILHLRYTAREGGALLKQAAQSQLTQTLRNLVLPSLETRPSGQREGLLQLVSLAGDLPDAWHRFLHPTDAQANQSLTLELAPEVFPFAFAGASLGITSLDLYLFVRDTAAYAGGAPIKLRVSPPSGPAQSVELASTTELGGLPHGIAQYGSSSPRPTGAWSVLFDEADNAAVAAGIVIMVNGRRRLNPAALRDLFVAVRFKL